MLRSRGRGKWSSRRAVGVASVLAGVVMGSVAIASPEQNLRLLQPDGVMGPAVTLSSDSLPTPANFVAYEAKEISGKDEKGEPLPREVTDSSNCGPSCQSGSNMNSWNC